MVMYIFEERYRTIQKRYRQNTKYKPESRALHMSLGDTYWLIDDRLADRAIKHLTNHAS